MGPFHLDDLGRPVSLRAARAYLARHGWRLSEEENRIVCEGPTDDSGQPVVRILPPSESYSDYPYRLEDLISTLSALEERAAIEIAIDMAGSDATATGPTGCLADELIDELTRSGVQLAPGKDPKETIEELRPLFGSVELGIRQEPQDADVYTQQAALLAARLAKLVASADASKLLLWRLCERVLSDSGLTLRLSPKQVDELYALAAADDPDSPDDVLWWIKARVKTVEVYAQRTEDQGERARPAVRPSDTPSDSGGPTE